MIITSSFQRTTISAPFRQTHAIYRRQATAPLRTSNSTRIPIFSKSYLYTTIVYTIFTCTYAINQLPTNFNDHHTSNLSQLSALRYEQLSITPLYGLVIRSARFSDAAQYHVLDSTSERASLLPRDFHVTLTWQLARKDPVADSRYKQGKSKFEH